MCEHVYVSCNQKRLYFVLQPTPAPALTSVPGGQVRRGLAAVSARSGMGEYACFAKGPD